MDPVTIAAALAGLAKLVGTVGDAYAVAVAGNQLSDAQKHAVLAAQQLATAATPGLVAEALDRVNRTSPAPPPARAANPTPGECGA